ncbi:MAG TPA: hypothetical protein VNZ62_20110 [Capillimicrobium sp.]|nr:hypothetical protein [Capillimicrobium sp.]
MRLRPVLACAVAACALTAAVPVAASAAPKVKANTAQTNAALEQVRQQVAELRQAVDELKGQQGGVAAILAAAPAIVDGLTQLKNGLETLAAAYQSVEYGIVQANVVGAGTIVNPPSWSGDIPDDGNGATTSGTATLLTFGAGGDAVTVTVNAYVRSNEANLNGDSGPVAQAGATLTVRDSAGNFLPCAQHGATGGVAMTPMGETIQTPTGPVTNLPLTNIRSAKPRTDQTLPGADAPQLVACTFASVAGVPAYYTLEYSASFLDIPRTTSPGPRD